MDVDRARTFLEIINTGSFWKAAERLNVTQTTVSARIKTLEETLGRQLFIRNRNGAQLTPAGREFEKYAASFLQVWERARHQLSLPEGQTSLVALGGELSLWDPLLLDWLIHMKHLAPQVSLQAHVGVPEHLMEQLRTGTLDIAVLYAPRLLPGYKIELVEEEHLILVRSTVANTATTCVSEYVHVDWGPMFSSHLEAVSGSRGEPGLMVGLGPLGLNYILRVGGTGYFRRGAVAPLIAQGRLEQVVGAPEFTYPAYAVYPEASEDNVDIQMAVKALKEVSDPVV